MQGCTFNNFIDFFYVFFFLGGKKIIKRKKIIEKHWHMFNYSGLFSVHYISNHVWIIALKPSFKSGLYNFCLQQLFRVIPLEVQHVHLLKFTFGHPRTHINQLLHISTLEGPRWVLWLCSVWKGYNIWAKIQFFVFRYISNLFYRILHFPI